MKKLPTADNEALMAVNRLKRLRDIVLTRPARVVPSRPDGESTAIPEPEAAAPAPPSFEEMMGVVNRCAGLIDQTATIVTMAELRRKGAHRQIPAAPHKAVRLVDGVWEKPCRWCDKPILNKADGTPDRRRNWHPECVELYLIRRSPRKLREVVWRRDQGVCAKCGRDTLNEFRLLCADLIARTEGHGAFKRKLSAEWYAQRTGDFWEADHIVPLIDGGSFDLDNVQTLCVSCHREKTAAEATARACGREPEPTIYEQAELGGQQKLLDEEII